MSFTLFAVACCIVIILVSITVHYIYERVESKRKPKPTTSVTTQEVMEKGLRPKHDFINKVKLGAREVEKRNLGELKLIDTYSEKGVVKAAFLDNHGVQFVVREGDTIGARGSKVVAIRKGKVYVETEYVDDYHGFTYIHRSVKKHNGGYVETKQQETRRSV